MEVMYRVMKIAAPFTNYVYWMDFLAQKDVVVSREVKPGNAILRGEVIKAELIETLCTCKLEINKKRTFRTGKIEIKMKMKQIT